MITATMSHDHKGHGHGTDISAYCLTVEQPLPWDAFHLWLGRVRSAVGEDLLRVKGILNLIDEPAPVVIHGVHHIFHPPVQLDAWPDADHRSRIVFITQRDRSRRPGSQLFRACRPTGGCLRRRALERDRPRRRIIGLDVLEASVGRSREAEAWTGRGTKQDPREPVRDPNDCSRQKQWAPGSLGETRCPDVF